MTLGLRSARCDKLELSDPHVEHNHLRCLTFNSSAHQGRGDVPLDVPPNTEPLEDLPLVVLLRGVNCSHWAYKGGAQRTAHQLIKTGKMPPIIIAMPSDGIWAEDSGYVCHGGRDYEAWRVEDVVGCVLE